MRAAFAADYARKRTEGRSTAVSYAAGAIVDAIGSGLLERGAGFARNAASALRAARTSAGLSATIVATMALAIGANVAIGSLLVSVYSHQLPFHDPATLMTVWESTPAKGFSREPFPYDDAAAVAEQTTTATVGFLDSETETVSGTGIAPKAWDGADVSDRFFDALGIRPQLGRFFGDRPEDDGAIVVSDEFWRASLGADPHVIGRAIVLGDRSRTVVGVLPPDTEVPDRWQGGMADFGFYRSLRGIDHVGHQYRMIARLRSGSSPLMMDAELGRIFSQRARAYPTIDGGQSAHVISVTNEIMQDDDDVFASIGGAVFIVLIVACANVSNLLLARGSSRAGEIAIRYSLGATRRAIITQLLAESSLLVVVGGACGIAFAAIAMPTLDALLRADYGYLPPVTADGATIALTLAVIIVAALLGGLAPAIALSRPDLSEDLKRAGRAGALGAGARLRSVLVAVEVAATIAVVIVAGLTLRTLVDRATLPTGFVYDHRYYVSVTGESPRRYADDRALVHLNDALLGSISAIPGVQGVTSSSAIPNWTGGNAGLRIDGVRYASGDEPSVYFTIVSPAYFAVLGTSVVLGRGFEAGDRSGTAQVAIVNRSFAKKYFGGEAAALGRRISIDYPQPVMRTIVGIAPDLRENLNQDIQPFVFVPFAQSPTLYAAQRYIIVTRLPAADIAAAVARAVYRIDPLIPRPAVRSLREFKDRAMHAAREADITLGILAAVALVLALGGVISVIAYGIARRRHEIGIRLALGAPSRSIVRLMLRSTAGPVIAGVALGVGIAAVGAHVLDGILIDPRVARPTDELALIAGVIVCVAAAAYLTARRATSVDPLSALRYD
jgi:putative ABC transport system permease protein